MKLSKLRPIVKEARRLGLTKLPGQGLWRKKYIFNEVTAHFYISNFELVYNNISLAEVLNMKYKEFDREYEEKFGRGNTWTTKSLNVWLGIND